MLYYLYASYVMIYLAPTAQDLVIVAVCCGFPVLGNPLIFRNSLVLVLVMAVPSALVVCHGSRYQPCGVMQAGSTSCG
jgi:hypothetical protein